MMLIKKIISGGQTGVDRAALDIGIALQIPIGGSCPKGRQAEDGTIDLKYPLQETSSSIYSVRTLKNVEDADGTLILFFEKLHGGTALTRNFAEMINKPFLSIDLKKKNDPERVKDWLRQNKIYILNI